MSSEEWAERSVSLVDKVSLMKEFSYQWSKLGGQALLDVTERITGMGSTSEPRGLRGSIYREYLWIDSRVAPPNQEVLSLPVLPNTSGRCIWQVFPGCCRGVKHQRKGRCSASGLSSPWGISESTFGKWRVFWHATNAADKWLLRGICYVSSSQEQKNNNLNI